MASVDTNGMMSKRISAKFDSAVDVLHVRDGAIVPCEGDGLPAGIELDFSLSDGRPCAVTVIGFRRNGWNENSAKLADIIGRHLSVETSIVARAITDEVHD